MKRTRKRLRRRLGLLACLLAGALVFSCSEEDDGDGTTPPEDFSFASDPPSAYLRVDRMGMPAVATALIPTGRKDAYNDADPADDAAGDFLLDIRERVAALHAALDDDILADSLDAATVEETIAQAVPLIVPDVLPLNTMMDETVGFPNGRRITDPVIDITLAVILLDLQTHTPRQLVGVLNPTENDAPFLPGFPYLAAPHAP